MSLDFGKLDFSTSFNRTSAFPLDARSYFESLSSALEAAGTARVAGSTDTTYYFGQTIAVVDVLNNNATELYVIIPVAGSEGGTLRKLGEGGGGTTITGFYVGYLFNNEFYKDSTYTEALPHDNTAFYLDINGTNRFYKYHGDSVGFKVQDVQDIPTASDEVAGIMKLYQISGQNTDGTMSQKTITDGVQSIKFAIDSTETECLVLDLPWD